MRHRQNITCRALMLVVVVLICGLGTPGISSRVLAQVAAKIAAPATNVPEPIYWKQNLFLIPYQWGSAAEPGAARAVWLFVSKDRGASWQKISEAKPDVKAFNYRAEGDGEYWFAVRTFDKLGRAWPQGPYQPELRVIVDTTLPRIDQLRARAADNGTIEIQGRASDANLDPSTWKLEWQANGMAAWQPVILPNTAADQHTGAATQASALPAPGSLLHASWHSPAGTKPTALRAIVTDRAGNSAMYQTRIESGTVVSGPLLAPPVVSTVTAPAVAPTQPVAGSNVAIQQTNPAAQGWGSVASASADNSRPISSGATPAPQPWPAGKVARAPFQLWTNGAKSPDDAVTAYGNPPLFNAPPTLASRSNEAQRELRVAAEYASVAKPSSDATPGALAANLSPPKFAELEPYRESKTEAGSSAASSRGAPRSNPVSTPALGESNGFVSVAKPASADLRPIDSQPASQNPKSAPKQVGSRTFALEYDLQDAAAVSKVELWGTRDRGQTWTRYAVDDDNRSPVITTVDQEGLYGFRIVVQSAGGEIEPPRPGDEPELWVSVDLERPVVELTAIERGQGNIADNLILRWRATDNNLEPRPISLFYSSRPTGPWSAIATNLENTGEYAWRVERYVPNRIYLRIEARDTAGNLAAFQTRQAVEFSPANVAGALRAVEPIGATATSGNDAYR